MGVPSGEAQGKHGLRVVAGDTEFVESSARTICARVVLGGGFARCCRPSGRYDGMPGDYYFRD